MWIHKIGHFVNSSGRCLWADAILPILTTPVRKRRSPVRHKPPFCCGKNGYIFNHSWYTHTHPMCVSICTNRNGQWGCAITGDRKRKPSRQDSCVGAATGFISVQADKDSWWPSEGTLLCTGFPDYTTLKICNDYLGPAVNSFVSTVTCI